MYSYVIKWNDGRLSNPASDCFAALKQILTRKEFEAFKDNQGRGYEWSSYRAVKGKYETATINRSGKQLAQVFRSTELKNLKEIK